MSFEEKKEEMSIKKEEKILDRDTNAAINILNRWFNGDSLIKYLN